MYYFSINLGRVLKIHMNSFIFYPYNFDNCLPLQKSRADLLWKGIFQVEIQWIEIIQQVYYHHFSFAFFPFHEPS